MKPSAGVAHTLKRSMASSESSRAASDSQVFVDGSRRVLDIPRRAEALQRAAQHTRNDVIAFFLRQLVETPRVFQRILRQDHDAGRQSQEIRLEQADAAFAYRRTA
jgi:hypothetical protein